MTDISGRKLLGIMLDEGYINSKQAMACKTYMDQYFEQKGREISLAHVLERLEILPPETIDKVVRALEKVEEDSQEIEDTEMASSSSFSEEADSEDIPTGKSLFVAYLLLLVAGLWGAHRFYLRKYRSGLLYSLTLGFLGIGVFLDLFLLPLWVKKFQDSDPDEFLELEEYQGVAYDKDIADWTVKEGAVQKLGSGIEFILQIFYLFVAPLLLAGLSILLWQPWMSIVALVYFILFLAHFSLRKLFDRPNAFRHIPFLKLLHQKMEQAAGFYHLNAPKSVLLYLFYPIWFPIASLFSKKRREESYLYLWISILAVVVICTLSLLQFYSLDFSFHKNLFLNRIVLGIAGCIVFFALSISIMVSLTSLRVKHKEVLGKAFSSWGALISFSTLIFFLATPQIPELKNFSHQYAKRRIFAKMSIAEKKEKILLSLNAFLAQIRQNSHFLQKDQEKKHNENLQFLLRGIGCRKEVELFHVTCLQKEKIALLVIKLSSKPLLVVDKNKVYYQSTMLPKEYKDLVFQEKEKKECPVLQILQRFDLPTKKKSLIEDEFVKK